MLLIYTPQNGEELKTMLDAMVTLMDSKTFAAAKDIAMILAVSMVGYQYVAGKKLESLMRYIGLSFFVLYALIGVRVNVAIIDMQYADSAGPALTVDRVPLGNALPAALISGLGYGITKAFSDVFHMPNDLDYTKTGMIFGARTLLAASNAELSSSPELARDVSSYIRQCIFAAKLLGSQSISPEQLKNNVDLLSLYFSEPSPIYRVILQGGQNLGCSDASSVLKERLSTATQKELTHLNMLMAEGKRDESGNDKFSNGLAAAHDYYMKVSKNAAGVLTQNILINATRNAAADAFAFSGADAELMNFTNTTSLQKMHIAEANSFWLASFRLPYYMTVMWMLTMCIFPLIVVIAFFPTLSNVYVLYLQSQAYLWSWPPMFIIIHFFVSAAAAKTINIFGLKSGGISFSNLDTTVNLHSNFAYTAGALAASVPFLAYYLTKGLSAVLSTASQHFGGMAQSLSTSEAQSVAQGHVSMASYSGWNMNYNNTGANKFDTNYHHAAGRATVQTANGALLSETADGSRIGNITPAISSAAVSVHGSDRVVDALHQSANQSFSNASNLRTIGDRHLQEGLSQLSSFNKNEANDYRSGEGLSLSKNDSYNQDLRKMQDAVHQFNKHHDLSHQISVEGAASYRLSSDKALWGKGISWVTGTSAELSVTARTAGSTHNSVQKFNNTSHGKAFNEAFSHMISTAKNNHLDASDNHNLSKSGQIAANFAKGESLLDQSSAEYSKANHLQEAASHARENAQSIDRNLNQPYHDWVIQHYGREGEAIMLKTDSASIAKQSQWANEFLNSSSGQSAVSAEVETALKTTNTDLLKEYDGNAKTLRANHNLKEDYQEDAKGIDKTSQEQGLVAINPAQLEQAKKFQAHNQNVKLKEDSDNLKQKISDPIKNNQKLYENVSRYYNNEEEH